MFAAHRSAKASRAFATPALTTRRRSHLTVSKLTSVRETSFLTNQRCVLPRARYVRQVSSTDKGTPEGTDCAIGTSVVLLVLLSGALPIFAHFSTIVCSAEAPREQSGGRRRGPTRLERLDKARRTLGRPTLKSYGGFMVASMHPLHFSSNSL